MQFLKMSLPRGPAKKICQQSAIGKLNTHVCNHTAMISEPAFLNNNVAMKLMIGHIRSIEKTEIARTVAPGQLFPGAATLKASFFAIGPATNVSTAKAIAIMSGSSAKAARNMVPLTVPVAIAIL